MPVAVPVIDTLKKGVDGFTAGTVDRAGLWRAQTPQGFRFSAILEAHRRLAGAGLTDDAAVAEAAGLPVALVLGSPDNLKVTTPIDLDRAHRLLGAGFPDLRTGMGFDVHRFAPGDGVMLCGDKVPHSHGLEGHSDADVALHALTDAILGAVAAGDIGSFFPPGDPRWKNADSAIFLNLALEELSHAGYSIVNVDATLVLAAPKISPIAGDMRSRVADLLDLPIDRVSIKAKTPEGLNLDHVAQCHAIVLVERAAKKEAAKSISDVIESQRQLEDVVEDLLSSVHGLPKRKEKDFFDTEDIT